jgi:sigma-B regulation protein RsbU (phosphoserine phosphatase)
VFVTGEPRGVADLLDEDLASGHLGTIALGIRHVLCVPLNLVHYVDRDARSERAKRIGVLYLDGQDKGRLLSPSTKSALETLAGEAALAIENARLYRESLEKARLEQQMKIGADIQQALLPPSEYVAHGIELACASVPCLAIGGDFIDYFELPNDRLGLVLGDVSGKGLPAALLSAILQGIFATEAPRGRSPAQAVAAANDGLLRKAMQPRYATVFHALVSPDGGFTYTNAGHNPPIHLSGDQLNRLTRGGTIVGVFADTRYEQDRVTLAPGDIVVIFSDGVTEAFDADGQEFGDARLIDCIRANRSLSPRALIDALMRAIHAFVGTTVQSDDQTVVVIRYHGI